MSFKKSYEISQITDNEPIPSPTPIPKPKPIKLLFVGDIMLDRGVAKHAEKEGKDSLFKGVESLFLNNDAVIGNL